MSNQIKQEIDKIEIPKELHQRSKLGVRKAKLEKAGSFSKKVAIPLVASTFLVLSAGVCVAYIPSINHLASIVSPKVALMLLPIETISEDEGIKMEVLAGMNDDDMAVIYVSLQDLVGDRIDETVDLYNFSLRGANMFNSQIVDYDEITKTATLRIQANGGEELSSSKVNFSIGSFLSNKQTFDFQVEIPLLVVSNQSPQTVSMNMNDGYGGGGVSFRRLEEMGTIQILKPNETVHALPNIDFMKISNIGMIDNRFHVQAKWLGENIDNHGYFYFIDDLGNKILPSNINFGLDEEGINNYGKEYTEYIFDLNSAELSDLKFMGYFVYNGNYTVGNWNTTFKMESVGKEIKRDFTRKFETWTISSIAVSPLGVTLNGKGELEESKEIEVIAKMNDGSLVHLDSMTGFSDNNNIKVKFISSNPIDPSEIKSISIDGKEIDMYAE